MGNAYIRLSRMPEMEAEVDTAGNIVRVLGRTLALDALTFDVPTKGTVYGVLLNYKGALAALGDAVNQAPYKAPPKAPVLYVKPVNTWIGHGTPLPVPEGVEWLEMGASLGIVIGTTACRVPVEKAFDHIAGYTVVNDVSVPHESYYRPSIRYKCRDGSCPIGPWVLGRMHVPNPDALAIRVYVNSELKQENTTANLIRSVARLLTDVTEFMTLEAGDVLLTGVPENAPLARAGDRVSVEIEGVGRLENPLVAERDLIPGGGE